MRPSCLMLTMLLLAGTGQAMAATQVQASPDGPGANTTAETTAPRDDDDAVPQRRVNRETLRPATPQRTAPVRNNGPRWRSFLPGMFR